MAEPSGGEPVAAGLQGATLRGLVRDTFVYGSGDVLLRAAAIFTIPIYTRVFSPEDYGIWAFVTTAVWLPPKPRINLGRLAEALYVFVLKSSVRVLPDIT